MTGHTDLTTRARQLVANATPTDSGHKCGNCEGIDPGSCLANPDRDQRATASDTATRARALLDAAVREMAENDVAGWADAIAACRVAGRLLHALADALTATERRLWEMDAIAQDAIAAGRTVTAERDAAVARADTLNTAIGEACRTLSDIAFEVGPVDDYTYRNVHAIRDQLLAARGTDR